MEFNPCFFCSSSIYPSTPVGVGASSSLNDNAKIRNLKTPLHTFSYFLIHTYGLKVRYLRVESKILRPRKYP